MARHVIAGSRTSPPDRLHAPNECHFLPDDQETGELLQHLRTRAEIAPCFIVKTFDGEVNPFGIALYIKKQCVIPAHGRYEFK